MRRPLLLALPAVLWAAPSVALTPQDLWARWQAQAGGWGFAVTAEAVPGEGGALTLRDLRLAEGAGPAVPLPPESPVKEVRLSPAADGAVAIELVGLPANWTVPGAADAMGDLYLAQRGLRLSAREDGDAVAYELAAESVQAASVPPRDAPDPGNVAAEVQGLVLRVPSELGANRTLDLSLALTGFAYVANLGDPAQGLSSSQSSRSEGDLTLSASVTVPEGIDWARMEDADVARALDRGLSVRLGVESGATTQAGRQDGFPFAYSYESTAEPGRGSLSLDGAGLTLDGSFGGGSVDFTSGDLGVPPVEASYGPLTAALRVPFGPQVDDLEFRLSFEDVTLGDGLWSALDPRGALPKGPLRLRVEGGGRMALDVGAMMAAEEQGMAEVKPPRVDSLELRAFEFEGAGLKVAASGELAFPGGNPDAPPTGTARVRLEGVDRMIDALVGAGWITEQDARDARLGLAAVMRPGGAPDTREAAFEFRADGSVIANGVQVQ